MSRRGRRRPPLAGLALHALLLAVNRCFDPAGGTRIFPSDLAECGAGGFLLLQRGQRLTEPQQGYGRQPQGGYDQQQIAAPAPIVQEPVVATPPGSGRRGRGDAVDPRQNPNAPGVPRALGGGQMPMPSDAQVGAPGGRGAGEPLNLGNTSPQPAQGARAALTTLPPSATPKDEFDLGIGYIQRKDYALAEETMKNFAQKYPSDPLVADSQYWLGESYFQRQQYRDAAETFLGVTTKFDKSAKAPDALLRLAVPRLRRRVSLRLLRRRHRRDIGLARRRLSALSGWLAAKLAQPLLELAVAILQLLVLAGQLPQLVFEPLDPHFGIGIVGLSKYWSGNGEQRRDRRGGGK